MNEIDFGRTLTIRILASRKDFPYAGVTTSIRLCKENARTFFEVTEVDSKNTVKSSQRFRSAEDAYAWIPECYGDGETL